MCQAMVKCSIIIHRMRLHCPHSICKAVLFFDLITESFILFLWCSGQLMLEFLNFEMSLSKLFCAFCQIVHQKAMTAVVLAIISCRSNCRIPSSLPFDFLAMNFAAMSCLWSCYFHRKAVLAVLQMQHIFYIYLWLRHNYLRRAEDSVFSGIQ